MMPNIVLNWPAIAVCIVLCFAFGGVWFGPLFGKAWGAAMGFDMTKKPDPKVMKRAFALQALGCALMVYVLDHTIQVWRASAWGVGTDQPSCVYAFFGGLFPFLGFYVPLQLSKVAWEMKPWKVFFINAGHDFIQLQFVAFILSYWR